MTAKWAFVDWGEPHLSSLADIDLADIKGYVLDPVTGQMHRFGDYSNKASGAEPTNKETA